MSVELIETEIKACEKLSRVLVKHKNDEVGRKGTILLYLRNHFIDDSILRNFTQLDQVGGGCNI